MKKIWNYIRQVFDDCPLLDLIVTVILFISVMYIVAMLIIAVNNFLKMFGI